MFVVVVSIDGWNNQFKVIQV